MNKLLLALTAGLMVSGAAMAQQSAPATAPVAPAAPAAAGPAAQAPASADHAAPAKKTAKHKKHHHNKSGKKGPATQPATGNKP
ncbi:hypothetical protein HUS70_17680 [Pandoraea nosoerga]|uniref:Uncharacterized protein n=1 Tax=Pandoraea nosoerga TaxID=2508296 RepID=A0A5E4WVT7_9BURK|nr:MULTISPECIES: hypothetical protein [Pandoraea]MBN4666365.1 hypothetical protein [Pandoraea nosoerga]MBN4675956.1 hypothetical protein [Pandoraea nosoerga]MBN4682051.1 hypothetical protein [Pandoraea nosoerga]MBN4746441.1 hypothetical protein [Pandoraea nosoerga]VVE27939.1 hypothetical protein PNO31109_03478 [Pandoraea nosoerga]